MSELVDKLYEAEVKKADHDHHVPTAGAMTGHILANLKLESLKLFQSASYVKGENYVTLHHLFLDLAKKEDALFYDLSKELLIEGELVPTTNEEITRYGKIEEAGKNKYHSAEVMLETFVKDFDWQNLFIDRAIKLAEKEEKFSLQHALIELLAFNKENILTFQALNGHDARYGLDDEDEDED